MMSNDSWSSDNPVSRLIIKSHLLAHANYDAPKLNSLKSPRKEGIGFLSPHTKNDGGLGMMPTSGGKIHRKREVSRVQAFLEASCCSLFLISL